VKRTVLRSKNLKAVGK